jgi:hypothetical protein
MAITINGTANTIANIAAGGLNDNVVDNGTMANNAIDSAELVAGAVDLSHLSATGTASATTFLRGDNAWAAAGGGKLLNVVHVQSTGSNYFDADNAFMDIPNTTITVTTTKLNSKIMIQWNSGIAVTTTGGDIDEVSFRVRRSIGGVDADVREDNQWSYFSHANSWHGPGQFHMMHLDSPAQASGTSVQYKLMGLVQQTNGKIYIPYGESGQANNMQIVAMELDI